MRIVTFDDLVPGLVLYPVDYVTPEGELREEIIPERAFLVMKVRSTNGIPSGMCYLPIHSPHEAVWTVWRSNYPTKWAVIDDQPALDSIRATIKAAINRNRDRMDEIEKFVDRNL